MSCRIAGLNNKSYPVGTVVTSDVEKRLLVLTNETTKATYEACTGNSEFGAMHMYVLEGGEWLRCLSTQYGCWAFFATPFTTPAHEVEVIENSEQAVELALRWKDIPLNTPYLNNLGVIQKDYQGALVYPDTSNQYKYLTSIKELVLSVRLESGRTGMFLGWHSIPKVGPDIYALKTNVLHNEETSYQERELGTGNGSDVVWSSGGHLSRHPTWGLKPEWATAEAILGVYDNHVAWCLIDDPTYGSYSNVNYIPTQTAGYPKVQAVAPWWVADINNTLGMCRYIAMRKPIETGVWQYTPYLSAGSLVCHFVNEWAKPNGQVFPFQIFLGAFKYAADPTGVFINEPKQAVKDKVDSKIAELYTRGWPTEAPGVWN